MTEFAWHVHHMVLLEALTEPIENWTVYIKDTKPAQEIPTRLRLLKPVRGPLPPQVIQALEIYDRAQSAYDKVQEICDQAWEAYNKAQEALEQALLLPEIQSLHAQECPNCPWDGETIFPKT